MGPVLRYIMLNIQISSNTIQNPASNNIHPGLPDYTSQVKMTPPRIKKIMQIFTTDKEPSGKLVSVWKPPAVRDSTKLGSKNLQTAKNTKNDLSEESQEKLTPQIDHESSTNVHENLKPPTKTTHSGRTPVRNWRPPVYNPTVSSAYSGYQKSATRVVQVSEMLYHLIRASPQDDQGEQTAASTEPWPPLFYDAHIGAAHTSRLSEPSRAGTSEITHGSESISLSGPEADFSNEVSNEVDTE